MDGRAQNGLTHRQEELLRNARDGIRKTPGSYSQLSYGHEEVDCGTPGCIAAQIVARDPGLQTRLAKEIRRMRRGPRVRNNTTMVAMAVCSVATTALGIDDVPKLFSARWPRKWKASSKRRPGEPGTTFVPTADDAVAVIDGILAGRITEALDRETA